MRRSERATRLARLADRLLGDARRILTVDLGVLLGDREVVQESATALSVPAAAYDGALVGVDASSATRALVAEVAARLCPGAVLLLVAPLSPSVGARARGLLTRTPPPRVSPAVLSEALLLSGLLTPRVHDDAPGLLLLSARLPPARTALDAFFAPAALFPQPGDAARR